MQFSFNIPYYICEKKWEKFFWGLAIFFRFKYNIEKIKTFSLTLEVCIIKKWYQKEKNLW